MTDNQLSTRIREELFFGCVEQATQFARSIQDEQLRTEMLAEIRRYEGSNE